jgi:hypothetical protein
MASMHHASPNVHLMQCIMRGLSRRLPFELVGHLTAVKVMVLGAAQANVTLEGCGFRVDPRLIRC